MKLLKKMAGTGCNLKREKEVKTTLKKFKDLNEMAIETCEFIVRTAKAAVKKRGYFSLVLSGGGAPKPAYELLATPKYSKRMPWHATYIFYQDDRYVSIRDMASNFKTSWTLLLKKTPIPKENICRMRFEIKPVAKAAAAYEMFLKKFFLVRGLKKGFGSFDIVIAGVGPDGHTSSLFPGDAKALNEKTHWIISIKAPDWALTKDRITMTFPLINSARTVLMLIGAPVKGEVIDRVLKGDKAYPASRTKAKEEIKWFIDRHIYM